MILPTLEYTRGWKYRSELDAKFDLPYDLFGSLPVIHHEEFSLYGGKTPTLHVFEGFLWDGPSGPTIDHKCAMTPSQFHDCMYYAGREGLLDPVVWRPTIDLHFYNLLILAGMVEVEALVWYHAVRVGAASAMQPQQETVITVGGGGVTTP
jgi:hypothetical protein